MSSGHGFPHVLTDTLYRDSSFFFPAYRKPYSRVMFLKANYYLEVQGLWLWLLGKSSENFTLESIYLQGQRELFGGFFEPRI